MSRTDELVEQQIRLHEIALKRVDELLARAREADEDKTDSDPLLAAITEERNRLASALHDLTNEPPNDWKEAMERSYGPLAGWELLARVLERAIEQRLDKKD